MKIEGLGETSVFRHAEPNKYGGITIPELISGKKVTAENMKIGDIVHQGTAGMISHDQMVITDVLGDGKFKAVSKEMYDITEKVMKGAKPDTQAFFRKKLDANTETFDISGKVDSNNPIYKFYEKEVGRYLKNKYNATQIVDNQGVSWWQLSVPKEVAKLPVEAFGLLPLGIGLGAIQSKEKKKILPTKK
jgi:hypothetical protein